MNYRYYPYSCARVSRGIKKRYPGAGELRSASKELRDAVCVVLRTRSRYVLTHVERVLANHILWMLDRLQTFKGETPHAAAKRGRWIGWVYAYCEWLGLFTQMQVHNMARRDSHDGTV